VLRIFGRRRALAPALIAIAFALSGLSPGAARAGTYDVTSCNPDGTAAGWTFYGPSTFARGITCPSNGDLNNRGLGAADLPNVGMLGYSAGGVMFQAPAGTSLAGIGGGIRVQRWDANYWLGLIAGSGQNLYGFWANDGTPATAGAYNPNAWFSLNHEGNVHLEVGCSGRCDTSPAGYAGYRAWAQMFDPMRLATRLGMGGAEPRLRLPAAQKLRRGRCCRAGCPLLSGDQFAR
jgi:hypothetical protein